MNLGDVYIKAAVYICIGGCLLALSIVLLQRCLKKTPWPVSIGIFVVLTFMLSIGGCYFGHYPLFRAWHHSQNQVLPQEGCLTYEPSFLRLHASYRMSRAEFDEWAQRHPWPLKPYALSDMPDQDTKALGFDRLARISHHTAAMPRAMSRRASEHAWQGQGKTNQRRESPAVATGGDGRPFCAGLNHFGADRQRRRL